MNRRSQTSNVSIPKKVLFIGLGILALGIVVLTLGLLQSPALWQAFQCGYDLGINNSSLTQEQISEYCNNNQILTIENEEAAGLITVGFGVILIVIGLITTGIGGIWLLLRAIRKQRTEASSSSLSGMSVEMMTTMNNRTIEEGEQDDWFTPKKVLAYCMIIGLISGTLSIFINSLIVLSIGAFVFASITLWYMFGDKFHRWKERSEKKNREEPSI
jgi:hypothetical protein